MRLYFFLLWIVFFLSMQSLYSQSYEALLRERAELLKQLEDAESQTSALFGKRSKKDLRGTTEILKEIVDKDTEIITVLRREINKTVARQQTEANPENDQRIIELENQIANLNNLANQKNIKTAELEQQVTTVKDRMFKYQSTILITFFIIFLLTIYISRLRKKTKTKA